MRWACVEHVLVDCFLMRMNRILFYISYHNVWFVYRAVSEVQHVYDTKIIVFLTDEKQD